MGEGFRETAELVGPRAFQRMHNQPSGDNFLQMAPEFTCAAFALELYFKSLRLVRKPDSPLLWGHDLWELFSKQDSRDKRRIASLFAKPTAVSLAMRRETESQLGHPLTVEFCLKQSRNAFKQIRYLFEGKFKGWIAWDVLHATRAVILELHPGWGPVLNQSHTYVTEGKDSTD